MKVPGGFLDVFGDDLPRIVKFQLPDGEESYVLYRKDKKKIYGIAKIFRNPLFEEDCCTIFNYIGDGVFCLYVFNVKFNDVPNACTGFGGYGQDNNIVIGWKFVSLSLTVSACDGGLIKAPPGHFIPPEVKCHLPNGQIFYASYSSADGIIRGLRTFHINDVLLFINCGNGDFDVILFGHRGLEKSFSPYSARLVPPLRNLLFKFFEFNFQDILVDFKDCSDRWSPRQYLTVTHGCNVFFLQLRKVDRRWKIHASWVRFSQLLQLSVDDVLVFDMKEPPIGFCLHVYRLSTRE
ncbi:hypothetical protein POM88_038630 [Heracleum sosnowskyi]|uniref:TF-B3 domain-containing protein n=1 Tax=Heracleum sosnowskyi TaxID=360622 RepID=A0AAD8H9N2_9APIA|nr:hypothetical protein POM88_038630 [Heracleum sosnowskyi]